MRKNGLRHEWARCRGAKLAAAAVTLGAASAASGQGILHGPIQDPSSGHWYALLQPSGWTAARDAAASFGGHLATVSNQAENDFLEVNLGEFFLVDGRLWIGFTDAGRPVNDFAWITGEPVTYTNWSPGEPNNAGAGEDATELLLSSGQWNDNADNPPFTAHGAVEWDEAVGACDVAGVCSVQTAADCATMGGTYQGDFSLCTGACCLADQTCFITNSPDCTSQNGTYQGDGTNCGGVVCPSLLGACCFSDGLCFQDSEAVCTASGGVFQGVGSDCATDCVLPANDDCASATLVGSLPTTVSGSTELANLDFEPQCGSNSTNTAPGVWFRLPGTGHEVTATLCPGANAAASANYDAQVSVYTDCGLLNCVGGSDDDTANGCGGGGGTVTFCTDVGTDYLILVHGWGGNTGEFTLAVTEDTGVDCSIPANDLCANAQALSLPALVSGNTSAATTDTAPACPSAFAPSSPGVWYSFMGTGAEVTATMCADLDPNGQAGADYDSQLSVFTDCGALTCVAGSDDACGLASSVAFNTTAGQQYLILVHGFGTGNFDLAVFQTPFGACCFNDGTCSEGSFASCSAAGGSFQGDGVSCGTAMCTNLHADDAVIALAHNFNGIVHAPIVPTEQSQPDNPNGYRGISDRGLRIIGGVAPDLAAAGAQLPYSMITTGFQLDMVHVGNRNLVDGGNWAFDAVADGDNIGIQPAWLTNVDQSTVSNPVNPGMVLDATSRVGVIYNASNGGSGFTMSLEFSDLTSVSILLDAPDWFADANGAPFAPDFGVVRQALLAGPLSGGDGFAGAGDTDIGSDSAPLNIVEAIVTRDEILADLGTDIAGKTLTGITFGGRDNLNAAVGIYAATVETGGVATSVSLALNFNGIVHSAASGGEQNMPNNLNGYRSISDRGLFFGDNQSPALSAAELGYQMVETEFATDIVFLGTRAWDLDVDADNQGVAPAWAPVLPLAAATTAVSPGVGMTDSTRIGVIYHAANGGCTFDVVLGFSDASSVTVSLDSPDWFANNNPQPNAPLAGGAVSQELIPGPLSGGDGFPGAGGTDSGTASAPLNIVEALITRDKILADQTMDISGKTLTSVTFNNKRGRGPLFTGSGGNLAVFAMSADGVGAAACPCEYNGVPGVDVFDLLGFLDLWFANDPGADIDGNPGVDVFDLLAFLDCWFPASAGAPCP